MTGHHAIKWTVLAALITLPATGAKFDYPLSAEHEVFYLSISSGFRHGVMLQVFGDGTTEISIDPGLRRDLERGGEYHHHLEYIEVGDVLEQIAECNLFELDTERLRATLEENLYPRPTDAAYTTLRISLDSFQLDGDWLGPLRLDERWYYPSYYLKRLPDDPDLQALNCAQDLVIELSFEAARLLEAREAER